jgi:prepilin-type N-terminal cleavage/methylation domain-containing protein
MKYTSRKSGQQKQQAGFSLIETMLVCAIIGIVAGFAVPNTITSIANLKLRGTASDFSGLVQRARTAAEQGNTTYAILFGIPNGHGAYVDLNNNGQYDLGEPMIQFGGNANQVAAPGGATGKPTNLDASGGPLGWTATSGNISFNSRGFPCSGSPCVTNVNYIFYFSDTRYNGSGWAAVSVTAAGHPKTWFWNGSSWIN